MNINVVIKLKKAGDDFIVMAYTISSFHFSFHFKLDA